MRAKWLILSVLLLLGLFHLGAWILPVATLFAESMQQVPGTSLLAGPLGNALREALPVAGVTFVQAAISTFLSLMLGGGMAFVLGRLSQRGRHRGFGASAALSSFLAFPFGVPSVVAGLAALSWVGAKGWLTGALWPESWAYSMASVIAVHVALNAPWVALRLLSAFAELPPRWSEAAATLGAGPGARLRKILLPALAPTLQHAGLQVFCLCASSFALVLMLGGGPPVETLETLIYSRIRLGEVDPAGALAAALIQLAMLILPAVALAGIELRTLGKGEAIEAEAGASLRNGLSVAAVLAFFFGVFPWIAGLALPGLADFLSDESISNTRSALSGFDGSAFTRHLIDSLRLSIPASLVTLGLGWLTVLALQSRQIPPGVRSFVLLLGILPSGLSVAMLSLGFWRFWESRVDPFDGSLAALVAIQSVIFLPLTIRILAPVATRTPWRLLEAAATLGASPLQAWIRIEGPRWRVPLLTAFLLVFSASLGEVAALSFFAGEGFSPIPLWLRELTSRYEFGTARAVSLVFLGILLGLALVASRFMNRKVET